MTKVNKQGVRDLNGRSHDAADALLTQHDRKTHVRRAAEHLSRALAEVGLAETELSNVPAVSTQSAGSVLRLRGLLRACEARLSSLADRMPPRSKS